MKNTTPPYRTPEQQFNASLSEAEKNLDSAILSLSEKEKVRHLSPENENAYIMARDRVVKARMLHNDLLKVNNGGLTKYQKSLIDHLSEATSSLHDLNGGQLFAGIVS